MDTNLIPRRALLALAAMAVLPGSALAASPTPTNAEILAVQAKFLEAIQNATPEVIAPMMSDKLTYLHASGGKNDKAKQLAMFAGQKTPRWIKIENRDLLVKPYPGIAIVTGDILFTSEPRPGQEAKANPYRHTTVWAREGKTWRLVNWQINNIVAPPSAAPAAPR